MTQKENSAPNAALLALGAVAIGSIFVTGMALAENATVVTLTQTGCQFVEAEHGKDHGYRPTKVEDCEAINTKTGAERLSRAGAMKLKPGKYVFRVTNRNVPYELGFWLRSKDYDWKNPVHKLTRTSVSGGGLATGKTKDYEVTLKAGEDYVYSCPLNPTPDYRIVVSN